jgi:arabinose-5-phosphate isomerase
MTPTSPSPGDILAIARRTLEIEAAAVLALNAHIDADFLRAVDTLLACKGRVVVSGMGKSGHIGGKIAASLASTGTPAFFMHPAEASHGDLGMITGDDVVIALSNSGESPEIAGIVPLIKRRGASLIGMTGNPASTLARASDIHLNARAEQEACPLNLAPTASTTAALAMGDALVVATLFARGFSAEDFARTHPGGALGRRLLVHVRDLMHTGTALPVVEISASLKDALLEMTRKGLGMTAIVDETGRLQGIFTDGDLRRLLDRDVDLRGTPIADVMIQGPLTISEDVLAVEAAHVMEQTKVNGLLVVNSSSQLTGALNMHDLLRAGVV